MKYAIIAAGEGSRLREEGIEVPKPLVFVNGERLIDRLLRIFMNNDATDIVVICNDIYPEVAEHLAKREAEGLPLRHIVKTTSSSMHSLYEISSLLGEGKFIATTVDTYFCEDMFKGYVEAFRKSDADGMMAVTSYCDDEKPLYVSANEDGIITGFHDAKPEGRCYVSAGIYGLCAKAKTTLEECINNGQSRMRNFQRALVANQYRLVAYPMSKVIDIDHTTDILQVQKHIAGIYRAQRFSPGSVEKDRTILDATMHQLSTRGYAVSTISEEDILTTGSLPQASCYLSMARSESVLQLLQEKPCINSSASIRYCNHRRYITSDTTQAPLWIKRSDQCSEQKGDVTFCATQSDVETSITAMRARGIDSYVMQPHYEGEHIKFYGVSGTSFFSPSGHDNLKDIASAMANDAGLTVYGGDAIISDDGTTNIIDLNDWPSFSPCVREAAMAIASVI